MEILIGGLKNLTLKEDRTLDLDINVLPLKTSFHLGIEAVRTGRFLQKKRK